MAAEPPPDSPSDQGGTLSEHQRIGALRVLFTANGSASSGEGGGELLLGIGDDAAIFSPLAEPLVVSVDAHVEGVHFTRQLMSLEDAGYRATMAALSDLAAMGAAPIGVLSSLGLPSPVTDEELFELARGQDRAARECGTIITGGNLSRASEISLTTTVLGRAAKPARRDSARSSDRIWIAGEVGYSAAGLALLLAEGAGASSLATSPDQSIRFAVQAFRRPRALIDLGRRAVLSGATAMIDVSDGLAQDLGHLAKESAVGIEIEEAALLDPRLGRLGQLVGRSALDLCLFGGEDFALAFAAPIDSVFDWARPIGRCHATDEPGVRLLKTDGSRSPLSGAGFDHFR